MSNDDTVHQPVGHDSIATRLSKRDHEDIGQQERTVYSMFGIGTRKSDVR